MVVTVYDLGIGILVLSCGLIRCRSRRRVAGISVKLIAADLSSCGVLYKTVEIFKFTACTSVKERNIFCFVFVQIIVAVVFRVSYFNEEKRNSVARLVAGNALDVKSAEILAGRKLIAAFRKLAAGVDKSRLGNIICQSVCFKVYRSAAIFDSDI